jgi:hypothetical protein
LRHDLKLLVPLMTLLKIAKNLLDVQDIVAPAHLCQRLSRVEPTMATAADVIATEEGVLGPWKGFKDFLHRAVLGDMISSHGDPP